MSLSQDSCSDYSIEIWTLAAEVDQTEDDLWGAYTRGLNYRIKDEIVFNDVPPDLDSLICLCNLLFSWQCEQPTRSNSCKSSLPSPVQQMTKLSLSTSSKACTIGSSLSDTTGETAAMSGNYCGNNGHFIATRPVLPKDSSTGVLGVLVGQTTSSTALDSCFLLPASYLNTLSLVLQALDESVGEEIFLDLWQPRPDSI